MLQKVFLVPEMRVNGLRGNAQRFNELPTVTFLIPYFRNCRSDVAIICSFKAIIRCQENILN
jgi:hypothetical protein